MIKHNFGKIINISSVVGVIGNYGQTNYSAAKAGLIGFTKALAKEVAKHNIIVNAICPGFTNTDMVKGIPPEILKSKILPKITLRRLAQTHEIAKLALFLASDNAAYITGESINISGGWS